MRGSVNRIGQTRAVEVVRLVAADTIEEKVLDVQARKARLIYEASIRLYRTCGINADLYVGTF